ncbi:MAG: DUF4263 domain-containing protein [Candidatus Kapabacteria bacterium]|nr:DUF4263 domain-containing protein [Candidatus Kapabacteria bacterium]
MEKILDEILGGEKKHEYPQDFPLKEFSHNKYMATKQNLDELRILVNKKASEKELHEFIELNPHLLSFALYTYSTGHHNSWVLSKQVIRPKIQDVDWGLIPDFIVGGKSSDGFDWWVIELKGANEEIFKYDGRKVYFSDTANKATFQCLEYVDYCAEIQDHLRGTFKLKQFREPNGLILMGHESELESHELKRKMKRAWNRIHPKKLEIRTYSWLLRNFEMNAWVLDTPDK